jgi:2',3'-cyclic-nucleotide 2'-phosphodiesterase (5'-nucleotidase family)
VRSAVILAVNDTYRIEPNRHDDLGGLARLRTLRAEYEANGEPVLLLHAGDFLSPSLLSKSFHGKQMIAVLNQLDGRPGQFDGHMLVTFGNHEFDESDCSKPAILRERIRESEFLWLAANIAFDRCNSDPPMLTPEESNKVKASEIVDVGGIHIGVFGLAIEASASGSRRPPPIGNADARLQLARTLSAGLRAAGADVVVALTHLNWTEDEHIMASFSPRRPDGTVTDGPDLLIGGHDHERMAIHLDNDRSIYKADADAKTASVFRVSLTGNRRLDISHRFVRLDPSVQEDSQVKHEADRWLNQFDEEYEQKNCSGRHGCLDDGQAVTPLPLQGDERRVRASVTTLGTWVTHEMLQLAGQCFPPGSVNAPTIAMINTGALRINGDIPDGARLTVRDIEDLLYYKTELKMIVLPGSELLKTVAHSFTRRGDGGWLQIAGMKVMSVTPLSVALTGATGGTIDPAGNYNVVANDFLLRANNDDGYDLHVASEIKCANDAGRTLDLQQWLMTEVKTQPSIVVPTVETVCALGTCGGDTVGAGGPPLRPAR